MKRLLINSLGIFFTLTILSFGCEDVDDGLTIELTKEYTETFNVNIVDENLAVAAVYEIDATEDQEVTDNLDNIEDYQVEAFSVNFSNIVTDSENPVSFTGSLSGGSLDSDTPDAASSIAINVSSLEDGGGSIEALADQPELRQALVNKIKSFLDANNGFKLYLEGEASAPVSFDVTVFARVKIKVGS